MKPIAIVAMAAESARGSGRAAYAPPSPGERAVTTIAWDPELVGAGAKRPFAARATLERGAEVDYAERLLQATFIDIARQLDDRLSGWRDLRIGVVLGTSSGGMLSLTSAFATLAEGDPVSPELARRSPYFGPLSRVGAWLGCEPHECSQVLAACASSGIAAGLGARWVEAGHVDVAIVGGYDAVSLLVAAGFECIGATSATRPAPFRADRDGMALGEGAALWALVGGSRAPAALGYLRGFGASADAVHITAPDREGRGLARAAKAALEDAGVQGDAIDLVSAHATATPYNDAAEAKAIRIALGAHAEDIVVHPFKAVVGHTLGASSVLEASAVLEACRAGVLPPAAGEGPLDDEARVRLLGESEPGTPRTALDLSAAFGGANAALVVSLDAGLGEPVAARRVTARIVGDVVDRLELACIADHIVTDARKVSRMDPLSALVVAAAGEVIRRFGGELPETTAVVVGTATASLENDELFHRRIRDRGVRAAEPRRFAPTSPNLPAGQCGIAFGLRGPALSVGAGHGAALEALIAGHDLVAAGDADAAVVVAAEHVAEVVPRLWRAAGWPVPGHEASAVLLMPTEGSRCLQRSALVDAQRHFMENPPESAARVLRDAAVDY